MRKIADENFDKVGGGWEVEVDETEGVELFWLKAGELNKLLKNGYDLYFVDIDEGKCLCEVSSAAGDGTYILMTSDKMEGLVEEGLLE